MLTKSTKLLRKSRLRNYENLCDFLVFTFENENFDELKKTEKMIAKSYQNFQINIILLFKFTQ